MVHKLYKEVINRRYMNCAPQTLWQALSVAKRMPSPTKLTSEWIMNFLLSYQNMWTRSSYYYYIKVICEEIGRLELLEGIPVPYPDTTVTRRDLLTPTEIAALLRACKDLYERALIEFLVESGCRIGEVMNLEAQDITSDESFLYVTVTGKTGERTIPLFRDNLPSFQYHLVIQSTGPVFHSRWYKEYPISYRAVLDMITNIFYNAGVRKRKRTIHIFRHTKATYLVEIGVPEAIIKKFMGWSESSQIITTYTHLTNKSVKDFFSRFYGVNPEPVEPLLPEEEKEKIKEMFR
jgi:integrase